METQKPRDRARRMELALAETLKECRQKIAAHVEPGPDSVLIPRNVYYTVQNFVEQIDDYVEDLVSDRDDDINQVIDELGQ